MQLSRSHFDILFFQRASSSLACILPVSCVIVYFLRWCTSFCECVVYTKVKAKINCPFTFFLFTLAIAPRYEQDLEFSRVLFTVKLNRMFSSWLSFSFFHNLESDV